MSREDFGQNVRFATKSGLKLDSSSTDLTRWRGLIRNFFCPLFAILGGTQREKLSLRARGLFATLHTSQ